jgi:hypothetical protein
LSHEEVGSDEVQQSHGSEQRPEQDLDEPHVSNYWPMCSRT